MPTRLVDPLEVSTEDVRGPVGTPRPAATSSGHDVICISSIDWHDQIWQGHQEIMSRLAASGHRVLFIENTGVRTPTWRDLPRLRQRLHNWWHSTRGFRRECENLFLYSPCVLPFPYARLARWINRWMILRDLRQWMNVMSFDRPVVWTFLPTPLAADIIRALDPKLAVYYCIDNLAMSSPAAHRIERCEQDMFRLVDTVFVTSLELRDRASAVAHDVHLFPFAVNFERFKAWRERSDHPIPEDIANLPRPRIGYIGGVHRWVDQELLCRIADAHPDWSLVLVGPIQTDIRPLACRRNIHLLGGKPHEVLPAYLEGFDVATIPYVITPYTQCVYPTKTNEYFAMGKPVVSTPLREIVAFNERHGTCISIGRDADQFAACVEAALQDGTTQRSRRLAIAQENSWQVRVADMTQLIARRIEDRERERISHWQQLLAGFLGHAQVRLVTMALAVFLTYLALCHTPLAWWLAEPLKLSASPRPADAIVVFGGGVGESGVPGQGYEERVEHAVQLYRAGYAPRLVLSSGYIRVFREAEVMRALTVSLGVPPEAISVEEAAVNTYESVRRVAATLEREGASSILVVSSPYHMRRLAYVFRRNAPRLEMIPAPVERTAFYAHDGGATPRQIRGLVHEYLGILYYWWKGWM